MNKILLALLFISQLAFGESPSPKLIMATSAYDTPINWAGEIIDSKIKENGEKVSVYWLVKHHFEKAPLTDKPYKLKKTGDGYFVIHLVISSTVEDAKLLTEQTKGSGSFAVVKGIALSQVQFSGQTAVAIETETMDITSEIEI